MGHNVMHQLPIENLSSSQSAATTLSTLSSAGINQNSTEEDIIAQMFPTSGLTGPQSAAMANNFLAYYIADKFEKAEIELKKLNIDPNASKDGSSLLHLVISHPCTISSKFVVGTAVAYASDLIKCKKKVKWIKLLLDCGADPNCYPIQTLQAIGSFSYGFATPFQSWFYYAPYLMRKDLPLSNLSVHAQQILYDGIHLFLRYGASLKLHGMSSYESICPHDLIDNLEFWANRKQFFSEIKTREVVNYLKRFQEIYQPTRNNNREPYLNQVCIENMFFYLNTEHFAFFAKNFKANLEEPTKIVPMHLPKLYLKQLFKDRLYFFSLLPTDLLGLIASYLTISIQPISYLQSSDGCSGDKDSIMVCSYPAKRLTVNPRKEITPQAVALIRQGFFLRPFLSDTVMGALALQRIDRENELSRCVKDIAETESEIKQLKQLEDKIIKHLSPYLGWINGRSALINKTLTDLSVELNNEVNEKLRQYEKEPMDLFNASTSVLDSLESKLKTLKSKQLAYEKELVPATTQTKALQDEMASTFRSLSKGLKY